MKCLIVNKEKIITDHGLYKLDDFLLNSYKFSEIFLLCGPGKYTETRINIAIGKALQFKKNNIYGINIVMDFCCLFFNKIIYKIDGFFFVFDGKSLFLTSEPEKYNTFGQNFNINNKFYIDTSYENIFNNLHKVEKKLPYQLYVDKFA